MADEAKDGRVGASARAVDRSDASVGGGSPDPLTSQWFAAAIAADPHALGALVRVDYGVVESRDAHGRSALHIVAVQQGEQAIEAAKVLISAGVPIDVPDYEGHTPLWHAIASTSKDMALFLLDAGAATDGCLHHAVASGDLDIVRELVDCGADLEETVEGETALDVARRLGFSDAAALIDQENQRRA